MRSARLLTIVTVALFILLCQGGKAYSESMGTAFTYQGRLIDGNDVADGLFDFQFKLFDDPCVGPPIAGPVNEPDLDVIDGYFTVVLDFGSSVFDGNAVWLEIGVRPGEMNDPNIYTTLGPRQEITPSPYTLHTRGIFVDNTGNIGIGTTSPDDKLDVAGHINASETYKLDGATMLASSGWGNIAVGLVAEAHLTSGTHNTALGHSALESTDTGSSNSAVGSYALQENTGGNDNTAVGYGTLSDNTTGSYNSATGAVALSKNTTGNYNVAVGFWALHDANTASWNSALGSYALRHSNTGSANVAVGHQALYSNTGGHNNVAVGYSALYRNTTGCQNSAVGRQALYGNSTAYYNSAFGYCALSDANSGSQNVAVGAYALQKNSTGLSNSAVGFQALYKNTNSFSSALGAYSLANNTSGTYNSAMGYCALNANTGSYNTALGSHAGYVNSTGNNNTFVGCQAGRDATGSNNVFLGRGAGRSETSSNRLYIANSDIAPPLIYGEFDTKKLGLGTTSPEATVDVNGTLVLENGIEVNEFSTDGTLADNSDSAVPTERAVKTYVDSQIVSGSVGAVPVGGVVAWLKSFPNTPALSDNFVECNGQTLNDANSPYDGQTLPDLNGNHRFLRGSTTSGSVGGSETHNHSIAGGSEKTGNYESYFSKTTDTRNHLPPYYEVIWIMRVK